MGKSKWSSQSHDPIRFGLQTDGTYLPSPEEIEQECLLIQAGWSRAERYRRRNGTADVAGNDTSRAAS
jgi:hypothetical protein